MTRQLCRGDHLLLIPSFSLLPILIMAWYCGFFTFIHSIGWLCPLWAYKLFMGIYFCICSLSCSILPPMNKYFINSYLIRYYLCFRYIWPYLSKICINELYIKLHFCEVLCFHLVFRTGNFAEVITYWFPLFPCCL